MKSWVACMPPCLSRAVLGDAEITQVKLVVQP